MKNWKISKLQIQAFKAFSFVSFDFEASALLTLDGPNGYGKTSVFDAVELLLTGRISRISELYGVVMTAGKKNYKDNLYWNNKGGDKDVEIRCEIVDIDTGEKMFFARVAKVADLKKPPNNKADNFSIFTLHKIDSIERIEVGVALPNNYFDEHFGENFCVNYAMLNYLQQGQSRFIFSQKITERKQALEFLLKTKDTKDQIDLCSKVERRLALSCSPTERTAIDELQLKINELSKANQPLSQNIEYKKISSREPIPGWDLAEPFSQLDLQQYQNYISELEILLALVSQKDEIRIRVNNARIDRYIAENDALLVAAIAVGRHIAQYRALNAQSQRLALLIKGRTVLSKSSSNINSADLEAVKSIGISVSEEVGVAIANRDLLAGRLNGRATQIVKLNEIRDALVDRHRQVFGEDESHCALCGTDWETVQNLTKAVDITTDFYNVEIGELATQVQTVLAQISALILPMSTTIGAEIEEIEKNFQKDLHAELGKNLNSFEQIELLNNSLATQNIDYSDVFTTDMTERLARKDDLIAKMRAQKKVEGAAPPVGWDGVIRDTFSKIDDFYGIELSTVVTKNDYLVSRHRMKQNLALETYKQNLATKKNNYDSAAAAKARISRLKTSLTEVERDYAARTISNIELIFHIYSGRLIQNYQRGLGLFIDYGDGKQLQFCTAEHSEHDATLSMSSGQLSALSLSFFLSLNRVYSKNAFVLIDDPAQSLDEINIASLTDLLRCELRDRQLLISSHEDDIAGYMRYRFDRAGLSQKLFHMQSHAAGNSQSIKNLSENS